MYPEFWRMRKGNLVLRYMQYGSREPSYGYSCKTSNSSTIALQKIYNCPEKFEKEHGGSYVIPFIFLFALIAIFILGWFDQNPNRTLKRLSRWFGNVKLIMLFTKTVKRCKKYLIPKK
jgi:hypothetical protein